MGLHALLLAMGSAITAAVGSIAHHMRTLAVTPGSWTCLDCDVTNELDRDTCWSCGAGYGQDPLYPSHMPPDRRWICMSCAVWNGIARMACWRCGEPRTPYGDADLPSPGSEPPRGSLDLAGRDASSPRVFPQGAGEAAQKRGNS